MQLCKFYFIVHSAILVHIPVQWLETPACTVWLFCFIVESWNLKQYLKWLILIYESAHVSSYSYSLYFVLCSSFYMLKQTYNSQFLAFSICLYVFNILLKASSQPEAQRKQISEHLLKKLMKKLQKYKSNPTAFAENFPLYVVLVVRMHRWDVVVRPKE